MFVWHRMLLRGSQGIEVGAWRTHEEPLSVIAHLYFETIHPFEDGNGRIGRAIAEKALSQGIGRPVLLSISKAIEAKKNDYYDALQKAQSSNEITEWINYFVRTILTAQTEAEELIDFTLKKTKFFDRFKDQMSERQLKVVRRMLEEGSKGFARHAQNRCNCAFRRSRRAQHEVSG